MMKLGRSRIIRWASLPSWLRGDRLRILMYHSIADNPNDPHAVSPCLFKLQMTTLAHRNYRVISLAEGVRRLQQHLPLRGHIVLTFDDGYRDFLSHALPVIEHFRYPATLFVPTGLLGGRSVWDTYDGNKRLVNWDELVEISHRDVTIASHTVTHARLTECNDRELEYELRASLETLKARVGDVFPALSYPGGYYGSREAEAAQRAGYICAVGVASRWGNGPDTNFHWLVREKPWQ